MPGSFKTEAVVLRSIRYGEADRVLHLYSADRGRVGAVAKGVRRVKSRLGGRLEPLGRVRLVLHEGRGELCTVTPADTVHAHSGAARAPRLARARHPGLRGGAAAARLRRAQPRPPTTCSATSSRCSTSTPARPRRAQALAFRLKLLLAAGFAPELAALRLLRRGASTWAASRPAPGGVVCSGCEAGSFPLGEEAHRFLVEALARPLAEAPEAPEPRAGPGRPGDRRDGRAPRARAPAAASA